MSKSEPKFVRRNKEKNKTKKPKTTVHVNTSELKWDEIKHTWFSIEEDIKAQQGLLGQLLETYSETNDDVKNEINGLISLLDTLHKELIQNVYDNKEYTKENKVNMNDEEEIGNWLRIRHEQTEMLSKLTTLTAHQFESIFVKLNVSVDDLNKIKDVRKEITSTIGKDAENKILSDIKQ